MQARYVSPDRLRFSLEQKEPGAGQPVKAWDIQEIN